MLSEIVKRSSALIKSQNVERSHIIGVGIGVPGLVDFTQGSVYYLPNVPHWHNAPLRGMLERAMRYRVFVDNDVNLMALAESRIGAAKGARNALCLTLGTGVGGGLILNGELFRGSRFCAGEIGHIPLAIEGMRCNCGGSGCLETYVGNAVILKEARKRFARKDMTLEELSALSKRGNAVALRIYKNFAEKIGIALSGIVNVLNPDVIVIGGGLSCAGAFIFKAIKQTIQERSMPVQAKTVRLRKAVLGNDAGLIGAALLVKENIGTVQHNNRRK